jgi:hypothetical protein
MRGLSQLGFFLSHRISFQIDFVSIVDNAIQDGVSQRWVLNELMPMIYGELTGDQGRPESVAIVDDFQEISTLF